MIVSGCYIYLATIPGTGVMPWMVTAIVVRELLIQGLRSHLEGQGQPFGARMAGKLKTVVQCLSISVVLLCLGLEPSAPLDSCCWIRDGLTWLAVALTLYSGLIYVWIAFPSLRGERMSLVSLAIALQRHYSEAGRTLMEWLESLVLGVVQGITEFLPVSSDGHLLLTQNLFAWLTGVRQYRQGEPVLRRDSPPGHDGGDPGHYREVIAQGWRGLLGADDVAPRFSPRRDRPGGSTGGRRHLAADSARALLQETDRADVRGDRPSAGFGFLVTAAVLLITAWLSRRGGVKGPAETTWLDALLIGLAQMFAPLPGVSRSGLTIAAAWPRVVANLGGRVQLADRRAGDSGRGRLGDAGCHPASLTADRVAQAVAATVLAGIVGYFAIIWLTKIVRSGRIW